MTAPRRFVVYLHNKGHLRDLAVAAGGLVQTGFWERSKTLVR